MSGAKQRSTATVSNRLLWPFTRTFGADPRVIAYYGQYGLTPADFIQPDGRLPHAILAKILAYAVETLGDPQLGLKSGQNLQRGDMDVLEYAASTCTTLRGALDCFVRFSALLHEGAEMSCSEEEGLGFWRYRVTDGVDVPPAEHDFVATVAVAFVQAHTGRDDPPSAVYFAHNDRTNIDAYERLFRCPIHLGAPFTGYALPAERMNWPLPGANPAFRAAYEAQLQEKVASLQRSQTTSAAVRRALFSQLPSGDVSMASIAPKLGMSIATLRRRLAEEQTTHSALLDEVRKELAFSYLKRPELSANEIGFLLRFSDPATFNRAFKRWTGMTPQAFRKRGARDV